MSELPTPAVPDVQPLTQDERVGIPRHVLVADGDERSRVRRGAQLRARGCQVSLARTGFETIVKACCHMPDLILLDDSLGEMDAAETARLLSTCPLTAHIPLVRLSAGRRMPRRVLSQLERVAV